MAIFSICRNLPEIVLLPPATTKTIPLSHRHHQVPSDLVDRCWDSLRRLARAVRHSPGPVRFGSVHFGETNEVGVNKLVDPRPGSATATFVLDPEGDAPKGKGARFRLDQIIQVSVEESGRLAPEIRRMFEIYVPYCFVSVHARRWKRAVAICHFAQSMDGRIASVSGDSRWIGDESNRVHSHRMRALCEAVLIGSGTLARDRPALTVRLVQGETPVRVVLGSSTGNVQSLLEASPDPVVLIGSREKRRDKRIRSITLEQNNGTISPSRILEYLYAEGIHSVYIEGGSATTSRFLEEDVIDIVQLHMSPMVLGSGVPSFSLPPINRVSQGKRFRFHHFVPVGNGVMFVGVPEGLDREGLL
ncbi:MAG: RibD family protein [Fidelibacterota bacterium]